MNIFGKFEFESTLKNIFNEINLVYLLHEYIDKPIYGIGKYPTIDEVLYRYNKNTKKFDNISKIITQNFDNIEDCVIKNFIIFGQTTYFILDVSETNSCIRYLCVINNNIFKKISILFFTIIDITVNEKYIIVRAEEYDCDIIMENKFLDINFDENIITYYHHIDNLLQLINMENDIIFTTNSKKYSINSYSTKTRTIKKLYETKHRINRIENEKSVYYQKNGYLYILKIEDNSYKRLFKIKLPTHVIANELKFDNDLSGEDVKIVSYDNYYIIYQDYSRKNINIFLKKEKKILSNIKCYGALSYISTIINNDYINRYYRDEYVKNDNFTVKNEQINLLKLKRTDTILFRYDIDLEIYM